MLDLRNGYFDGWASGGYKAVVEANPGYWRSYLESYPDLVFRVDADCHAYLMDHFGAEVRTGLASHWETLFSVPREKFLAYHTGFKDELVPHFQKRPGLWFYLFRYDVMKVNPRTKEHTDAGYLAMVLVKKNWGILDAD